MEDNKNKPVNAADENKANENKVNENKSNNKEQTDKKGNVFGQKMTKQEWREVTLKRNQMAIINDKTSFVITEAYKTARTNIIFSVSGSTEDECKVIALTSASPGEGKTTSCLNLAITFAQTGARVLIIDGDLRKPRIHQYLGVSKSNGLSTVLSKQKTYEEVVFRNIRKGLDCIAAGSIPPNPAELLASAAMSDLLSQLRREYDYIFIDTPPVTVVTDAVALSTLVSGVLLVVRVGLTSHENIEHSITLLKIAKAKILGFFVNDTDPASLKYGSYRRIYGGIYGRYGYRYGGRYGYRYGGRYGYRYGGKYGYGYRYGNRYGYRYGGKYGSEKAESKEVDVEPIFASRAGRAVEEYRDSIENEVGIEIPDENSVEDVAQDSDNSVNEKKE